MLKGSRAVKNAAFLLQHLPKRTECAPSSLFAILSSQFPLFYPQEPVSRMSSREKNGRKHNHPARNHAGRNHRDGAQAATINKPLPKLTSNELRILLVSALLAVAAGIWAYWDSFLYLWKVWESDPDYSHGYLVAPLAVFFLYLRRKSFPGVRP